MNLTEQNVRERDKIEFILTYKFERRSERKQNYRYSKQFTRISVKCIYLAFESIDNVSNGFYRARNLHQLFAQNLFERTYYLESIFNITFGTTRNYYLNYNRHRDANIQNTVSVYFYELYVIISNPMYQRYGVRIILANEFMILTSTITHCSTLFRYYSKTNIFIDNKHNLRYFFHSNSTYT